MRQQPEAQEARCGCRVGHGWLHSGGGPSELARTTRNAVTPPAANAATRMPASKAPRDFGIASSGSTAPADSRKVDGIGAAREPSSTSAPIVSSSSAWLCASREGAGSVAVPYPASGARRGHD